jgi:hypothetical protein
VAHDAARFAALVHRLSTDPALTAGCFEAMVEDLRLLLRRVKGRKGQPSAAIFDSRVLQSIAESGGHSGYDGAKRRKGSKVHVAVDTLVHLLTLLVTPANGQDRAQVGALAHSVQEATGQSVELASSIRPTLETRRLRQRPPRAPSWPSSSCQRPNAVLSCCPGAGWWSAP